MMETEKIYHDQPYLTEVDAWLDDLVVDEKGNVVAMLSKTIFYPQGGGQMGDRGTLRLAGNNLLEAVPIVTTKKNGPEIAHHLQCSPEQKAELRNAIGSVQFKVMLDWDLRYHQMRIHSAAHLLHCMMEQVKGGPIQHPLRSPLTDQDGENQYEAINQFDAGLVAEAVTLLNAFVTESHPISTRSDDSMGPGFRWWECEKWKIPCGGVHPADAKEIGQVRAAFRIRKGTSRVTLSLINS